MAAFHAKPERLRDAPESGTARDDKDRYETPDEVTEALLRRFGHLLDGRDEAGEATTRRVVDPCCGTKRVVRCAARLGYEASGTDLEEDGLDFLTGDYADHAHDECLTDAACLTNPPYKHARQFVERALELFSGPVMMLLPADFLWSEDRCDWLSGPGRPQHVLIIPWRIKFFRRDGTRISGQAYSHQWCVWPEKGYRRVTSTQTHWAKVPPASVRRSA